MKKHDREHEFQVAYRAENEEFSTIFVMVIIYCTKCGVHKVINEEL